MNSIYSGNLGTVLVERMDRYSDKIALIHEDKQYTYRQLKTDTLTFRTVLQSWNLSKGDHIAIKLNSHYEFLVVFLAAVSIGVIPVLLLPNQGRHEIEAILNVAEPKACIFETYEDIAYKVKHFHTHMDIIDALNNVIIEGAYNVAKLEYSDVALMLLSGGTTGIPKLIPRTQGDYLYNIEKMCDRLQLKGDDVYLLVLPMAHNFGLANPGILGMLYVGGTTVVCDEVSPLEIFDSIEKYHVTFTAFVPSILRLCVDYAAEGVDEDIHSLKLILSGGAMLPTELAKEAEELLSVILIQVFGTAEGLICTNELSDPVQVRNTTQGKPISKLDVLKITDESGKELPRGKVGELRTKGPYTIHGYYKLNNNADYFDEEGFYRTGDKAYISADGNLCIAGRIKEQINRSGEKIMPSELEEIIACHEYVKDCVVVGLPDSVLGQRICAFVIGSRDITTDEIREYMIGRGLAAFKIPDEVRRVRAFPYTPVGKVDKKRLEEEYK